MRLKLRMRIVVVLSLLVCLALPAWASAGEREEGGGGWGAWIGSFLEKVEAALGLNEPDLSLVYAADDGGYSTNSSGCIDPFGRPKPCL